MPLQHGNQEAKEDVYAHLIALVENSLSTLSIQVQRIV